MTLEQLNYFSVTAQLGSFSKAAENVHISQPSLSIAIHKLEKELGIELFYQNRRGAILTDAGRLFFQDTQNILQQCEIAVTHMRQYAQRDSAEVRIAYTSSMADFYIPRLLKNFLENEGKNCCIYSDEMPSDQIAKGIREKRFDLGIGSQLPTDPELEQIPIDYQRFCLIVPEGETIDSSYEHCDVLEQHDLICYRQDYPMYRQLSSLFADLKVSPHISQYTYSENSIAHLVEQGLGIAIVAETGGLQTKKVQVLYPEWLNGGRYIYLFRPRIHTISSSAQLLQTRILNERRILN